jgi:putative acetyltransferase
MLNTIKPVRSDEDLKSIVGLFQDYAASLDIDLTFQDFALELESLPGKYAPPVGELLLAMDVVTEKPIGCVGIRPLLLPNGPKSCEMKRLYVNPAWRGRGLGRALANKALEAARDLGYERILLDTLQEMNIARALYKSLGFEECEKYYNNPLPGVVYLSKNLAKA